MTDDLDRNKDVVRAHFAALNSGEYEALSRIHDPAGRNHAPAPFDLSEWPSEGKPFGPAEVRETFEWLRAGAPDMHVELEDLVAEGDQVVAWIRMSGTQTGAVGADTADWAGGRLSPCPPLPAARGTDRRTLGRPRRPLGDGPGRCRDTTRATGRLIQTGCPFALSGSIGQLRATTRRCLAVVLA